MMGKCIFRIAIVGIVVLGLFGGWAVLAEESESGEKPKTKANPGIRVITYNVRAFSGYQGKQADPTKLNQAHKLDQIIPRYVLELQLYEPDIICLQEAHSEKLVAELAKQLEMNYVYFPGGWKGKGWQEGISGAILTRFKILESKDCPTVSGERPKDLFSRFFGRVLLQSDTEKLAVYGTHLLPFTVDIRLAEIKEILAAMKQDVQAGRSILVLGDLNHSPTGSEYKAWAEAGMLDTFVAKGVGQPLTCPSIEPRERIDYIWAYGPIARRLTICQVLYEGAFRTYLEDPRSFALSDHVPVLAIFN